MGSDKDSEAAMEGDALDSEVESEQGQFAAMMADDMFDDEPEGERSQEYEGTIHKIGTEYGFISCSDFRKDLWFSWRDLPADFSEGCDGFCDLKGQTVNFRFFETPDGKLRAKDICVVPTPGRPLMGLVKSVFPEKGYGFIVSSAVEGDIFLSKREMPTEIPPQMLVGLHVRFQIAVEDEKEPDKRKAVSCVFKPPVPDVPGAPGTMMPMPMVAMMQGMMAMMHEMKGHGKGPFPAAGPEMHDFASADGRLNGGSVPVKPMLIGSTKSSSSEYPRPSPAPSSAAPSVSKPPPHGSTPPVQDGSEPADGVRKCRQQAGDDRGSKRARVSAAENETDSQSRPSTAPQAGGTTSSRLPSGAPIAGVHGNWQCTKCNNVNFAGRDVCNRCQEPKPVNTEPYRIPQAGVDGKMPKPRDQPVEVAPTNPAKGPQAGVDGNWACSQCQNVNFANRMACNRCQAPRPGQVTAQGKNLCRQFARGYCELGSACKFLHVNVQTTAAQEVAPPKKGTSSTAPGAKLHSGAMAKDSGKFGFIQPDVGEDEMFVMPFSCTGFGGAFPPLGTRVLYEVITDAKTGKPRAENVVPVEHSRPNNTGAMLRDQGKFNLFTQDNSLPAQTSTGSRSRTHSGTLINRSDKFGFIKPDSSEEQMFILPQSCTLWGGSLPPVGTRLCYEVVIDAKTGKPRADNVQLEPFRVPASQARQDNGFSAGSAASSKHSGTLIKDQGKFGFIKPDFGEEEMFCLPQGKSLPPLGTRLVYDVILDPKTGKPRADFWQIEESGRAAASQARPPGFAQQDNSFSAKAATLPRATGHGGTMSRGGDKFGFIKPDLGAEEMFVLPQFCLGFGGVLPPIGARVRYEIVLDSKTGKPRADNVQPEEPVRAAASLVSPARLSGFVQQDKRYSADAATASRSTTHSGNDGTHSGTFSKDSGKFGFIKCDIGEEQMFVMPPSCSGFGGAFPALGTRVLYEVVTDAKTGKPRADNMRPEEPRHAAALQGAPPPPPAVRKSTGWKEIQSWEERPKDGWEEDTHAWREQAPRKETWEEDAHASGEQGRRKESWEEDTHASGKQGRRRESWEEDTRARGKKARRKEDWEDGSGYGAHTSPSVSSNHGVHPSPSASSNSGARPSARPSQSISDREGQTRPRPSQARPSQASHLRSEWTTRSSRASSGTISMNFDRAGGCGYLVDDDTGEELPFVESDAMFAKGEEVEFQINQGPDGSSLAVSLTLRRTW